MPKISVIVPVYNAEEYLGYCINSILSQTYTDLELILVNDGSTDRSLDICNNYQELDNRVIVIDIPNGGVGNARNNGLSYAKGEYVQFVDSDDVIHTDMIKDLISTIELYHKDIIICGMQNVVMDDEMRGECWNFDSIGSECVLDHETFLKELPYLLWNTVLMEGPCNRIYRKSVITNNDIVFPSHTSYGEDFLFNLDYYQNCNGAVLLNKTYYYYIHQNKESLSSKFIPNLFENQKTLVTKLRECLSNNHIMSEEGEKCLDNYAASHIVKSIQMLFHPESGLSIDEKKELISKIIADKKITKTLDNANYMNDVGERIRQEIRFRDVGTIYIIIENSSVNNSPCFPNELLNHTTILNRIIRKLLVGVNFFVHSRKIDCLYEDLLKKGIWGTLIRK